MAFLKALWKGHSKHKKLSDEWDLAPEKDMDIELEQPGSTMEGITFHVKYIGSTIVTVPSSAKATADAVKTIVTTAKSSGRKGNPVQFAISLRGVSVMDTESKTHLLDISLYRISYCSADATYGHVFAFIATDDDDILQCHAFLCQKRKMAQLISITVAQTFNTAFHLWQMSHNGVIPQTDKAADSLFSGCMKSPDTDKQTTRRPQSVIQQVLAPIPMLIDLTTPIEEKPPKRWTSFDD